MSWIRKCRSNLIGRVNPKQGNPSNYWLFLTLPGSNRHLLLLLRTTTAWFTDQTWFIRTVVWPQRQKLGSYKGSLIRTYISSMVRSWNKIITPATKRIKLTNNKIITHFTRWKNIFPCHCYYEKFIHQALSLSSIKLCRVDPWRPIQTLARIEQQHYPTCNPSPFLSSLTPPKMTCVLCMSGLLSLVPVKKPKKISKRGWGFF